MLSPAITRNIMNQCISIDKKTKNTMSLELFSCMSGDNFLNSKKVIKLKVSQFKYVTIYSWH